MNNEEPIPFQTLDKSCQLLFEYTKRSYITEEVKTAAAEVCAFVMHARHTVKAMDLLIEAARLRPSSTAD